jgi:hypothetical protein
VGGVSTNVGAASMHQSIEVTPVALMGTLPWNSVVFAVAFANSCVMPMFSVPASITNATS